MRKILAFILLLTIVSACDEVDTSQLDFDYDYSYFPADSGDWREYEVLQITIDKATDINDTLKYYLLEQLGDIYIDASNDTTRSLNRYYKDSIHKSWQLISVWYMGLKTNEAIQVEENIKYIKQKYPLQLDKSWNGNAYNRIDTLNKFNYTITKIDEPEVINAIAFDSVLKVSQYEFLSLIQKYSYFEKYGKGIGLLEREQVEIYSTDPDGTLPIEKRVETGLMYYQQIIDYGKAN